VLNGDLMFFIEASLHQLAKGDSDS